MYRKKWMKTLGLSLAICLAVSGMMSGCGKENAAEGSSAQEESSNQGLYDELTTPGVNVYLVGDYSEKAVKAEWDEASSSKIVFSGNNIAVNGQGAAVETGVVTITEPGTYVLEGDGAEVQVVVDVAEEENIQLVLNGVTLQNSTTAPINIKSGKNAFLTLAEGTENKISDTRAAYVEPEETETTEETTSEDTEEAIEAAVYSEIDLILNGTGALTVEAGYDDGIRTKDDMEIISGTYHVTSQDDAFVGKDSISVRDGNITVNAKGSALKSSKSDDLEKGYVVIDGGNFDLTATEGDGLHAEYALVINDGNILIRECEEGLEAMNIVINGGNIELTSTDDGVNISEAEEYAALFGSQSESAEDSSANAEASQKLPEGFDEPQLPEDFDESQVPEDFDPSQMQENRGEKPEGFDESQLPEDMELPEGFDKSQVPEDVDPSQLPEDIELPEGSEDFTGRGFGGGMNGDAGAVMEKNTAVDHIEGALIIAGGTLNVTAQGDGLDSNGDILITGGTTIVCGPTNSGDGSLDYADTFDMTGGVLAISGSEGMEQNITSENIPVATMSFSGKQAAGTEVVITDADGKELIRFTAKQEFSYVAFASADLAEDETCTATAGSNTAEGTAAISQNAGMGMGGMMPGGPTQGGKMQRGDRQEMSNGESTEL